MTDDEHAAERKKRRRQQLRDLGALKEYAEKLARELAIREHDRWRLYEAKVRVSEAIGLLAQEIDKVRETW